MKLLVLAICIGAFGAASAEAQTLQIQGVAGYLSEYELTAEVSASGVEHKEFSGPLTVKHVGVCTHSGPDEMLGQMSIRFLNSSRRVEADLSYGGRECVYTGDLSEAATSFMTCANNLTLPVRLWTKQTP